MLTVEHKEEPRHTCPSSLLYVVTNHINKTDLHHPLCAICFLSCMFVGLPFLVR